MDVDKHQPHVFNEVDLLPFSPPLGARGMAFYTPPPVPGGHSKMCGVCHLPKGDRIHIDGESAADAESPNWG